VPTESRIANASAARIAIQKNVTDVVVVPEAVLEPLLCALVVGGHVLIEGVPGTGKTLLARALAKTISVDFRRIQFTNDLMPSDVVGTAVWRPDLGRFTFVRGPLFANLVLADEINRTSPRTLSCLLEAMENGFVSVEGRTFELGKPFTVLATRNPIEFHGTYPVPEAALDRFLVCIELGYPDAAAEIGLYSGNDPELALADCKPVIDGEELLALRDLANRVQVAPALAEYVYRVIAATRSHANIVLGASPRAALSWLAAAKARALLHSRDYVVPDDLKALARPALAHRIFASDALSAAELLPELIDSVEVPL